MDSSSQFIVPTIIDVPELIVTNEDVDFDDGANTFGGGGMGASSSVWSGKLQFLGSALSYTIGLGNIWRFPYLCHKYAGGAFLAAYSLIIVAVGLPLFLMELAFGQYANEGPITIWRISPAFEGIGYSMCLISAVIAIYYNLINAWLVRYLFATLTWNALPWTTCDNSWNGPHCFLNSDEAQIARTKSNCTVVQTTTTPTSGGANSSSPAPDADKQLSQAMTISKNSILAVPGNCSISAGNASAFEFDKIINTTNEVELPANEYFHNNVLASGSWLQVMSLMLVWSIVFLALFKNLRPISSSRLTLVSLAMPYLSLFALLVRSVTLPGAELGVQQYFSADWERLQNIDIWSDAITQVFYSLSPCWGGIITLANMNKFHNNFHSDTMLIVAANYLTSLAAGLAAFATMGFMAQYSGIRLSEVADSGPGLVFLVYTEALAQLPLASLNALVFFATLLFLGLTSQLTVIETVVTTIVDTWPHKLRYRRPLILVLLCGSMLLVSLPVSLGAGGMGGLNVMLVLDAFAGTLSGMFIGILELIAIAWVYGMENFIQDIDDMISVHRPLFPSRAYWYFMWRYLTPSLLFAVLLFCLTDCPPLSYRQQPLPDWTNRLGWSITAICISVIPVIALVRFILSPSGSVMDKISYLCRPSEDWAPSSYISGPKLINRHQMLDDSELQTSRRGVYNDVNLHDDDDDDESNSNWRRGTTYTSKSARREDDAIQDDDSKEDEDLKLMDGRANYIIAEDDDEDEDEEEPEAGLIPTSETNV